MQRPRCYCSIAVTGAIMLSLGTIACACNVPVFRFALERWRADPYRLVLLHRGPLTAAQRELIHPLAEQQDKGLANLVFRMVDVKELSAARVGDAAEDTAADRELVARLANPSLPCLVVQYPAQLRISMPVWTGPLEREAIASLLDSPIRQELVRRLAEGQTAVWLLLESGDPEQDAAVATLVTDELKKLEQQLKLPELTASPDDELAAATPFKLAFSLLRVPRSAAEQSLVAMLIGCEPDLAERSEAMVFPVFGRGRALLPLVGAGITAKNIHDSAAFLAGPCSCQVKEQNPGFDLLLAADWDALISQSDVPLAVSASAQPQLPSEAQLVSIPPGAAPAASTTTLIISNNFSRFVLMSPLAWIVGGLAVLGGLLIVGLISATQFSGPHSPRE